MQRGHPVFQAVSHDLAATQPSQGGPLSLVSCWALLLLDLARRVTLSLVSRQNGALLLLDLARRRSLARCARMVMPGSIARDRQV